MAIEWTEMFYKSPWIGPKWACKVCGAVVDDRMRHFDFHQSLRAAEGEHGSGRND